MWVILAVLISLGGASAEDLHLSEAGDIANLALTRTDFQNSTGSGVSVGAGLVPPAGTPGVYTKTLTYNLDVAACSLSKSIDGHDRLLIDGLLSPANSGRPELPMKTLTVRLDKNAEVLGIKVMGGSYREVQNTLDLGIGPEPRAWMRPQDVPKQVLTRYKSISMGQPPDGYFPGEPTTFDTGKDNDATYVNVRIFPIQYAPRSKKAVLITDARIDVSCLKPHLSAVGPDGYSNEDIPMFRDLPLDKSRTIDVISNCDSPAIDVTSIYTWHDTIVKRDCLAGASVTHTFTPTDCGQHLVRAAAVDGKEGWLYVNTQFVFIPTCDLLLIDADDGLAS